MLSDLDAMEQQALAELSTVLDGAALEAFRVRWLGTNGRLRAAMDALKSAAPNTEQATQWMTIQADAGLHALGMVAALPVVLAAVFLAMLLASPAKSSVTVEAAGS